jgi:hypothetical protein
LPDVRRPDARSAQICRPDGVARFLQVSAYSVEPPEGIAARNLLSSDRCRSALADEPKPLGPKVPLVGESGSSSGDAEGLAGATPGPNRSSCRPSGEAQGMIPSSDPGEEMRARHARQVARSDLADVALVDTAGRDEPGRDELA